MSRPKLALALIALATIVLVGCKQPAGLPDNVVHAATTQTVYCYVEGTESHSGYVSMWAGAMIAESAFAWYHTKITRGYRLPGVEG